MTHHVLQFNPFEILPDAFVRIQLWRVAGQPLQIDTLCSTSCQKLLDRLTTMDRCSVPNDQQLAVDMMQHVSQKAHHLCRCVGVILHPHQQSSLGRDRADARQMVVPQRCAQDWCLANRRIGSHQCRQQIETRFIDPNQRSLFVGGFFLSTGQRSSRQRAIAASSRCVARSIGFWTLQPTALSRRPIWSRWYETPNSRLMRAAMRARVQMSPRNPKAWAPRASKAGNR